MKIAIDLDEVVFNYVDPFLDFVNSLCGTNFKREQLKGYRFEDEGIIPKGTNDTWTRACADTGHLRTLKLIPNAKEIIHILLQEGHEIIFITSRDEKYREDTYHNFAVSEMLLKPKIIFSTKTHTKADIINELQMDILIDDSPKYINEAAQRTSAKTILFSKFEKSIEEAGPNCTIQVDNWKAVYRFIYTLTKKAQN